jgi:pyruvate dehydrogenase E1 component
MHHVQLFGSGAIMQCVLQAQELLAEKFRVSADVWSATSYQQLRNEALSADRWNRLHPESNPRVPYIVAALKDVPGPIVAATDYVKTIPDLIRPWIQQTYVTLGTDGYGRSDTREALRRLFEVDAECIAVTALHTLSREGLIPATEVAAAIRGLGIDPEKPDPLDIAM